MIEMLSFVAFLVFLLFAVPIRIGASGLATDGRISFKGYVRILLGLLGLDVIYEGELFWRLKLGPIVLLRRTVGGKATDEDTPEEEDQETAQDETTHEPDKGIRERLTEAERYYFLFRSPISRLLKRLLKTAWVRCLVIDGTAGAGAPDVTGRMMGYVYAAQGILGKRVSLRIQPNFAKSGFVGMIRFEIWFWLGFLILVVLAAALSIGVRYVIWYLQEWLSRFRRPKTQTA